MTGAHLSHDASRRADGLATSAVLDQKYLPHAIETTRRYFEISDVGAGFKPARPQGFPRSRGKCPKDKGGTPPSIKRA